MTTSGQQRAERMLLRRVWTDSHVPGKRVTAEPPALAFGPPRREIGGEYKIDPPCIVMYERSAESRRDRPMTAKDEAHMRRLILLHEIVHALLHPAGGHGPLFRWLLAFLEHRYGEGWHSWYSSPVCEGRPPRGKEFRRCSRLR